ncbi:MAG TPA: amidohydrolase family protein [Gaiellaceae bacterium]|nr:amidohydrolase family protein [Gaiellaceae bacterium]
MALGPVVLPGAAGTFELDIADGQIETIRPVDAERPRLALPAFADLHVHADRAYAGGPRPPRSLADAAELVSEVKRVSTEEAVRERALRLLRRALAHGTLRVRTHVDVDELVDERALRGVLAARAELAGRLDVEIVAFGTKLCDPTNGDGRRRLVSAVETGADLVGAVPAFHADPGASIAAVLALARDLGVRADLHVDETTDPSALRLERVADETLALGLEGRVSASHCCSLASVPQASARRTIEKVAAAGITVIAQPALNLYLQDRGEGTPRGRGVTLVRELLDAGVEVRFGSDNVCDVFYPYGDADPLESAFLAALTAHVDDEDALLAGICAGRTRVEAGDPADLVLLDAGSVREALARRPGARTVLRAGEELAP